MGSRRQSPRRHPISLGRLLRSGRSRCRSQDDALRHLSSRHQLPKRDEQLARQSFLAPAKLDADRLVLQAAQRDLDMAEQTRHVAQHELETVRAALTAVRLPTDAGPGSFAVRSPIAGRVLRIPSISETTVALGTPLLEIGDIARLEIVAELLTTDALQTRPGALVRIERWGGSGDLEGRVSRIEPSAFTKVSALGVEEQRVPVIVDLDDREKVGDRLGDGFRIEVEITLWEAESVTRVPVSALFRDGDHWAAFLVAGGRASRRPLAIGHKNSDVAEVLEGLAARDQVIAYPVDTLAEGAKVVPR